MPRDIESTSVWPISRRPAHTRRALLVTGVGILAAGLLLASGRWLVGRANAPQLLATAQRALDQKDYARAEMLGRSLATHQQYAADGWMIAAESALRQERFDDAFQYYAQVPATAGLKFASALFSCGEVLLQKLQLSQAEDYFRRVLAVNPDHLAAHDRLGVILGIQGRQFEAHEHRLRLVRAHKFSANHLVMLAIADRTVGNSELVEKFRQAAPGDPRAQCGVVRELLRVNRWDDAERMLLHMLQLDPNLLQAQAWQGNIYLNQAKDEAFVAWNAALPSAADGFPEIWLQRGDWAKSNSEHRVAIRCYWEAARLDANLPAAHYQLGQLLAANGEAKQAEPFLRRAQLLEELVVAARSFYVSGSHESAATAAELTEKLGRYWESLGWNEVAHGDTPPTLATQQHLDRLWRAARLEPGVRVAAATHTALHVDLSGYPFPRWPRAIGIDRQADTSLAATQITFSNLAAATALDFTYFSGNQSSAGSYYYQHNGGGVAILDYDGDNWPDLYFTQGCSWPPRPEQHEHLDRLYRNMSGRRFVDVTELACLHENGFSQGVTVGDYDNDGFDDLYVCNIGANRFYRNNGDGTFADVTDIAGVAGKSWSSSCALADMNGDSAPDLYVVNYLEGPQLFDRPCQLPNGMLTLCAPHAAAAAPDNLYLNLQNGRFAEISSEAGIDVPQGKGLGIVAGILDDSGRISLFIANDAVPNFFFQNETRSPFDAPRFAENALAAGLAVDEGGRSQACMGVAAVDATGDGMLDLFVTNFRHDSNTFYVQSSTAQFVDQTRRARLRDPSYEMVGWGTQFLDADLDGWPDLVLANGHVSDMSSSNEPYEMPPQFFRNEGNGRFVELPASSLGEFFEGMYVGRALVRLDWNRDGLDDFAVNDLAGPAALVTNQTRSAGHYLAIRLHGVESSRDAIGATAILTAGDRRWVTQLTTGDGYQARNERTLRFGIGDRDRIDTVEIRWPSGCQQTINSPPPDTEWIVVEGQTIHRSWNQ
jgi:tetratricopeptide (TPR) repeat protein